MSQSPIDNTDPFEAEAEIILLQEQLADVKKELKRTKTQLRDANDEKQRANNAKDFCLKRAR